VQFGSLPDPEQARVRIEWLQRFRQSQQGEQQSPQQPQESQQQPSYLRDPKNQVESGDILRSRTGREIKVIRVLDNGNLQYHWKKQNGEWSSGRQTLRLSTFLQGQYTLKERPQPEQAPEPEQQRMPRSKAIPEGFETVDDLSDFKVGDGFYEDGFRGQELHKVKEVRDGRLIAEGGVHYYPDEIEKQRGGGYLRKPAPQPEAQPEAEPEAQPEAEADPNRERPFGDVRDPKDLAAGDVVRLTRRYGGTEDLIVRRVGDKLVATTFAYGRHGHPHEVTEQFLADRGAKRLKPEEIVGRLKRHIENGITPVRGEQVQEPRQMRQKGIMRVGDGDDAKHYYVSKVEDGKMLVQEYDPASKRRYGRPKELTADDLKEKEFLFVQQDLPQKRKPPGDRIKRLDQRLREGKIVKIYSDKKPSWARVVSVSREGTPKLTLQRVNSRTGRDIGDPEEFTASDLLDWAHIRRVSTLPKKLRPPPKKLTGPDGEEVSFAEKGQGELTPNFQPHRYDDVEIQASSGTAARLRTLLGDKLGDRDPVHIAADLAGAGGISGMLRSLTIRASGNHVTVTGSGPGVGSMSRTITFDDEGKPKSISNSLFKVKGRRGRGIGTKMLATQVAMAREFGFEYISTQAAGSYYDRTYKGYYAWPALGYSAAFPDSSWSSLPPELKAKILEVYPRKEGQLEVEMPRGLDFVHVMAAGKEVRDWWRRYGRGRRMTFPLGEDSLSVKALTKYAREKAEAAGVGADEFLQRSASLSRVALFLVAQKDDEPDSDKEVEEAPEFDDEDEKILDKVWKQMRKEMIDGR
jgi:GNAT superfamily N-acetyltransferase